MSQSALRLERRLSGILKAVSRKPERAAAQGYGFYGWKVPLWIISAYFSIAELYYRHRDSDTLSQESWPQLEVAVWKYTPLAEI